MHRARSRRGWIAGTARSGARPVFSALGCLPGRGRHRGRSPPSRRSRGERLSAIAHVAVGRRAASRPPKLGLAAAARRAPRPAPARAALPRAERRACSSTGPTGIARPSPLRAPSGRAPARYGFATDDRSRSSPSRAVCSPPRTADRPRPEGAPRARRRRHDARAPGGERREVPVVGAGELTLGAGSPVRDHRQPVLVDHRVRPTRPRLSTTTAPCAIVARGGARARLDSARGRPPGDARDRGEMRFDLMRSARSPVSCARPATSRARSPTPPATPSRRATTSRCTSA